jgi:hypothetical protein
MLGIYVGLRGWTWEEGKRKERGRKMGGEGWHFPWLDEFTFNFTHSIQLSKLTKSNQVISLRWPQNIKGLLVLLFRPVTSYSARFLFPLCASKLPKLLLKTRNNIKQCAENKQTMRLSICLLIIIQYHR